MAPPKLMRSAAVALAVSLAPMAAAHLSAQEAAELFQEACAECHSSAQSGRTPTRYSLSQLTPRAIVAALGAGVVLVFVDLGPIKWVVLVLFFLSFIAGAA